jgi:hypothetical protein
MKKKIEHTTIRNQNLFCTHCGRSQVMTYPIEIDMMTAMMTAFNKIHKNCPPTWKEPEVPELSEQQRANWWITHGHVGMSSKSIWAYFMGQKEPSPNHPYDPDDFGRCYKLFKAVPEWRERVSELKSLSVEWHRLSLHWDKLTEMYEQNEREDWKNYKQVGMYEFMKDVLSDSVKK